MHVCSAHMHEAHFRQGAYKLQAYGLCLQRGTIGERSTRLALCISAPIVTLQNSLDP